MARRDTSSAAGGPEWVQRGLLPEPHLQIELRVLTDVDNAVSRYQIEVSNPVTKELLAMRARPFHNRTTAHDALWEAYSWAVEALAELQGPDGPGPFD